MSRVHEDTANANAMVYLDDSGHEINRMEFLASVHDGQWSYMLYVGGGYVPLRVAVTTNAHRSFHAGGESDAVEAFEGWARDERPEEIGEGPDYEKEVEAAVAAGEEPPSPEYELHMEEIPKTAGTDPASINQEFFIDHDGNVMLDGALVANAFDENLSARLTYADFESLRAWKDMRERLEDMKKEGMKAARARIYARRPAGMKEGRVGLVLRFGAPHRGRRWGEGAVAFLEEALAKLVAELTQEGWAAEVRPTETGFDLSIESKDFDGFHWTTLEIPLRSYKIKDYLVGL